jgi:hypothetical protein
LRKSSVGGYMVFPNQFGKGSQFPRLSRIYSSCFSFF